jgi:hypothetical protein
VALAKSGKIKGGPPPGHEAPADKAAFMQDGLSKIVENSQRYVPIPAKYGRPESTDIQFSVKGGDPLTYDIDLKSQ